MFSIENRQLRVSIASLGAEIQQLYHKDHQLEYLWKGDPAFWSKRSPVLFPIVGSLKKDTFQYQDKSYTLGRHGFAREKEFRATQINDEAIVFLLTSDEETLKHFPFLFEFRVSYSLSANDLEVGYDVKNRGEGDMFFSVGGHPAFALPLVDETTYEDYYLEFNEDETKPRWPISKEGLIEKAPVPLLKGSNVLPLTKKLFLNDALVLKYPTSSIVSIKSEKTSHGVDLNFSGFPFLGIWAAANADFVCLEPWCGIADSVDSDMQLTDKEGINKLIPGGTFHRKWILTLF
jgi:galactose mutarotase-like enzyme